MFAKVWAYMVAVLVLFALIRSLKTGKVELYGGDAFSPSRASEPFSYWFVLLLEAFLAVFFLWLAS
jgi:hypothetical protein